MKYVISVLAAVSIAALAGCDRPATTTSTTVVKEPTAQTTEKETIVKEPSTTIVQAPAQSTPATPETTEKSKSTRTTTVDTPYGTASKTETEVSKTTKQ